MREARGVRFRRCESPPEHLSRLTHSAALSSAGLRDPKPPARDTARRGERGSGDGDGEHQHGAESAAAASGARLGPDGRPNT